MFSVVDTPISKTGRPLTIEIVTDIPFVNIDATLLIPVLVTSTISLEICEFTVVKLLVTFAPLIRIIKPLPTA